MDAELLALVECAQTFHFSDRSLRAEHESVRRSIAEGNTTAPQAQRYRDALQRYFRSFDSQTRAQLRDLDRRLADLAQVQLNVTAERNVAVKRLENIAAALALVERGLQ